MSKKTSTHKLGHISDQPNGSPFTILKKLRMPGWYPDADDKSPTGDKREELYLEEAIQYDRATKKFQCFPVPNADVRGHEFTEPGASASDADWRKFNEWILGKAMPADDRDFSRLIRALADLVRQYNASLYRLRRLHFYAHSHNDPQTDSLTMPPRNPHGEPMDPIPDVNTPAFNLQVEQAEKKWQQQPPPQGIALAINEFIEKTHAEFGNLKIIAADMIEVNGYIVSMRVIADTPENIKLLRDQKILQVGGSSSHVSISSAFSSP